VAAEEVVVQGPEESVRAKKEQAEEVPYHSVWNCLSRSHLLHQCKIPSSYMSQARVLPTSAQCLQL